MNYDKIFKTSFRFLIIFTLTLITLLTSIQNKTLESQLYETKQELSTQRFYNRLIEQQLHQLREKDTP